MRNFPRTETLITSTSPCRFLPFPMKWFFHMLHHICIHLWDSSPDKIALTFLSLDISLVYSAILAQRCSAQTVGTLMVTYCEPTQWIQSYSSPWLEKFCSLVRKITLHLWFHLISPPFFTCDSLLTDEWLQILKNNKVNIILPLTACHSQHMDLWCAQCRLQNLKWGTDKLASQIQNADSMILPEQLLFIYCHADFGWHCNEDLEDTMLLGKCTCVLQSFIFVTCQNDLYKGTMRPNHLDI